MTVPPSTLSQFDIAGRSAFVTGAASGIGLAYAETMAEAGAKVTLSDVDGDAAEREAARCAAKAMRRAPSSSTSATARAPARSWTSMPRPMAASTSASPMPASASAPASGTRPAIATPTARWTPTTPALWDKIIAINLTGAYNTIRDAARIMKAQGRGGSIVATASNAGIMCEAIVPMPYMPSKAGVIHMVKHLAFELGEYRIRVNAILPGPFVTNIADGHLKNPVVRKAWDDATLMGRIADTWQIKPLALYLASDASSYVTGTPMLIDGGMALGRFE